MKKLFIFLILLVSTSLFSETLEKARYSRGVFEGRIKENSQIDILTSEGNNGEILIVTLSNVNRNRAKITYSKDSYVDSISVSTKGNDTVLYFFLKSKVNYEVYSSKKEFQIKFSEASATSGDRKGTVTTGKENTVQPDITKKTERETIRKDMYTIVVDAGHGGHDAGAVGNGYREKDIALDVALKLGEELSKDYNVIMTRKTDIFKTLQERPEMGNNKYADLFVSIHLNSASSSSANGTEVYYYNKKSSASYGSEVAKFENNADSGLAMSDYVLKEVNYRMNQHRSSSLATDVLNGLLTNFALRDRGVKSENFAVLRGSNSPSILIELGFMSNYGDVSQFVDSFDQERAARSIADAIRKHFIK